MKINDINFLQHKSGELLLLGPCPRHKVGWQQVLERLPKTGSHAREPVANFRDNGAKFAAGCPKFEQPTLESMTISVTATAAVREASCNFLFGLFGDLDMDKMRSVAALLVEERQSFGALTPGCLDGETSASESQDFLSISLGTQSGV